jgi:tRNA-modifying protein YgfZ
MHMLEIAELTSRALVAVNGDDWRSFLHNLLTNDVETLQPGQARFAGLLTLQGRLLFDIFVVARDEGAWLDVAADRRSSLIQRLQMYRLRAKVTIGAADGHVLAAWGERPAGPGWIEDPRLPSLGWRGYGVSAAAQPETAYHDHRLRVGAPDADADCPPDKTYPIEANFDLMNGIDFKKGCFVGQETTSRMKRRGHIRNRMMPISFEGPPPAFGSEVLAGELRAGEVLSGEDGRAMALLRLDRLEAPLTVGGRAVHADTPAWWPQEARPTAAAS